MDVRALRSQDLVRVPYPAALKVRVLAAKKIWEKFYGLPDKVKRALDYQADTLVSGVGYQGPETGCDPKEHVHIRLSEASWLRMQASLTGNAIVIEFIEAALQLCEELKEFMREFLEAAEREFGIAGLVDDVMALADSWTLRFLHYLEGKCSPGEPLAAQHLDKGGLTGHLYESAPGFERLTRDREWEPISFGDGETVIIAGARLQHRTKGKIIAVCHRVVANERTARVGRDSIVCFFDMLNAAHYNKAKHGSMQSFKEGFNYPPAPFSAFDKLFTAQEPQ